ncbi:MAG TPA: ferritin-like domain-containing protein [Haliangium sp.]|nr:ferritin-like domain-containing protein [Haliangium sp.]
MSSESLHEAPELISEETKNMHRAIVTLIEELEAVDWYQQRADACSDKQLRELILHNKHEEIEHAVMTLEWIRRNSPEFDEQLRTYMFSDKPIVGLEEEDTGKNGHDGSKDDEPKKTPIDASGKAAPARGSLGIGSLKVKSTKEA